TLLASSTTANLRIELVADLPAHAAPSCRLLSARPVQSSE
ncbi:MAG: hypothetical protein ACI841_004082, partial [Planctomycetota bacterium]